MSQQRSKIPRAVTKTQYSQINKCLKKKKNSRGQGLLLSVFGFFLLCRKSLNLSLSDVFSRLEQGYTSLAGIPQKWYCVFCVHHTKRHMMLICLIICDIKVHYFVVFPRFSIAVIFGEIHWDFASILLVLKHFMY